MQKIFVGIGGGGPGLNVEEMVRSEELNPNDVPLPRDEVEEIERFIKASRKSIEALVAEYIRIKKEEWGKLKELGYVRRIWRSQMEGLEPPEYLAEIGDKAASGYWRDDVYYYISDRHFVDSKAARQTYLNVMDACAREVLDRMVEAGALSDIQVEGIIERVSGLAGVDIH